jgi:hypothetical protein
MDSILLKEYISEKISNNFTNYYLVNDFKHEIIGKNAVIDNDEVILSDVKIIDPNNSENYIFKEFFRIKISSINTFNNCYKENYDNFS